MPRRRGTPRRARAVAAVAVAALGAGCAGAPAVQEGWQVTVYYTAVESFHDPGTTVEVVGCPVLDCSNGTEPLGAYPSTFVAAVEDEGTGRITDGPTAGRYLNWSYGEGFWLDDAPRDQAGRPLEPLRSAAADGQPDGTAVRLVDCGRAYDGGPVAPRVCALLRSGRWEIRDAFTPGYGGERHIDLYLGEEDGPGFTTGEFFTTLEGATLELSPPR